MKTGLRILHLIAPAAVGGAESIVVALAAGHRAAGHDVRVAPILEPGSGEGHPFLSALASEGIPAAPIIVGGRDYFGERRLARETVEAFTPAIVHSHGFRPDVLDAGVARALGIPVVTTVHGFTGATRRTRLYEWLQVRTFPRFDAVVAVSATLARLLASRGVPERVLRTIVNAFRPAARLVPRPDARARLGVPVEGARIGWVGRYTIEKGADVLLAALAQLDAPASLIGDGRERAAIEALARPLAPRVTLHGAVPAAGTLIGAFDVLVISSHTEGTPVVLFEAMAAGVPIVTTAVGGIPDVVSEKEAWLVPAGDPVKLAAAIREALDNPAEAAARAAAARRRLDEQFAPGPWLDAYVSLYEQLLAR